MIDPKKSMFRRSTIEYTKDSLFEIIDIDGALKKNKVINKCQPENFLYKSQSTEKKQKLTINLKDYFFEFDNGRIKYFSDYFDFIEVIGEGAYGVVVSARDKEHKNNLVAIKIIPKFKFQNISEFVKREIYIQTEMNHKNVLKLNYIRENMNYVFLVMDLMQGGTLKDLIYEKYTESGNFFNEEEAALIIKNILEGLRYLNSIKVVHRDIKPENIMLRKKGDYNTITIVDFGFSTIIDHEQEEFNCGTLIYMSPETLKKQTNDTTDSWACGFILYILCSGGQHPLFRSGMSFDQYSDLLKSGKDWTFPEGFPILARNLFLKLCKFDKHRRYEIQRALSHPWITRKCNLQIPLTLLETYTQNELLLDFKTILGVTLFLKAYKKKFNHLFVVKTAKLKESPKSVNSSISKPKHKSISIINLNLVPEEKSKTDDTESKSKSFFNGRKFSKNLTTVDKVKLGKHESVINNIIPKKPESPDKKHSLTNKNEIKFHYERVKLNGSGKKK